MRLCGRFCLRHWQLAAKRLKKDQATDSCLSRAARSESSATQFLSLTYVKCSDICANRTGQGMHSVCSVSVISSSSASREREVYEAKGERGRGLVPRTDFAFSLAATFDTCYAFVCCPSRGRGQRRGSPLFPFYCVLKYLHNENEAFPYTHMHTRLCVCVYLWVSALTHCFLGL